MERGDRWISDDNDAGTSIRLSRGVVEIARIDPEGKKMWRSALRYSALGLEMGVAVAIGYGIGWWLDTKLGTKPYLMLVMLLLGIAAGFRGLIRAAKEAERESHDDERDAGSKDDDAKR